MLFANLSRQLQNYKQFGPPQIERTLITCEDIRFTEETVKLTDDVFSEFNENLCDETHEIELQKTNVKTSVLGDTVKRVEIAKEINGISNYAEDLEAYNDSNGDVKVAPSNVDFDQNEWSLSSRDILENPMLDRFEVAKWNFSSQVAGKLLVLKQENVGSMESEKLKRLRWSKEAETLTDAVDDRINAIKIDDAVGVINTDAVQARLKREDYGYRNFLSNRKCEVWLSLFMESNTIQSEKADAENVYYKIFGQVLVTLLTYIRLSEVLNAISMIIKMFLVGEGDDGSSVVAAFDFNSRRMSIITVLDDEKRIIAIVSNEMHYMRNVNEMHYMRNVNEKHCMRNVKVSAYLSVIIALIFIATKYSSIKDPKQVIELNVVKYLSQEEDAKAVTNIERAQSLFLNWKEDILNLLKCCIRFQGMSAVRNLYGQNVKSMLLLISNLPRKEKILSCNIDARNVSIKYLNKNENISSFTLRASSQPLKLFLVDDIITNEAIIVGGDAIFKNVKMYLMEGRYQYSDLSAVHVDDEVIQDIVIHGKANDSITKFNMNCAVATDYLKDVTSISPCNDIVSATNLCGMPSKSPQWLERVHTSRRMDDMIEVKRMKALRKANDDD